MRNIAAILASCLLLAGCSPKLTEAKFDGEAMTNKNWLAPLCASIYPCQLGITKSDTVTQTITLTTKGDTVKSHDTTIITLPGRIVTHKITIHDTTKVADVAAINSNEIALETTKENLVSVQTTLTATMSNRNDWREWCLITSGILAAFLGFQAVYLALKFAKK